MVSFRAVLLAATLSVPLSAQGAAWPAQKNELVITETTLLDLYSYYARNSTNLKPLQEYHGSLVQAGDVRRWGFLLGVEYGLTERFTIAANIAFFYTQHLNVGENVRIFTNSEPNTQRGFQDFTGNLKYTLFQLEGPVQLAVAPNVGWQIPLWKYDTSVNNPIGDGVVTIDPGLAVSLMIPASRFYVNGDLIYKFRQMNPAARVGAVQPAEIRATIPDYPLIGGKIYDQLQATLEVGYFLTDWLSLRGLVRRIETLHGEDLTFEGMDVMMGYGLPRTSMFQNSLAYDQDALFVGGGLYVQLGKYFGVGATYTHAVWFRNFPNMKTVVLSFSFNPQLASLAKEAELRALEAQLAEEERQAAEAAAQGADAPPPSNPSPELTPK
jgi:hypothetical protein